MDLGECVLTLTVDSSGVVTGLAKAKDETDQFVDKTKTQTTSFKDLWDGAMAILSAAGVLAAIKGIKKIIALGEEMLDAFAGDERAVITLTMALASNATATEQTVLSLHAWAEGMQEVTEWSNDVIEQNLVLLSGMGMSEDRMKEVMTAAMNLASVYHISLEQAVRGLASSLESGSAGMLTRYIPTLKQFTDEQMKHGAAVNWAAEQYPNAAKLIGDTTAGLQIRMKNLIDEQKEKIGEVIAASYAGIEDLQANINTIGDIAAIVTGVFIKSLIMLADWFKFSYTTFTGFLKMCADLVVDVAKILWAPIEYAFHDVIQAVKNFFVDSLNWIIEKINSIGIMHFDLIKKSVDAVQPLGKTITAIWDDAKKSVVDFGVQTAKGVEELISIWQVKTPTLLTEIRKVQTALGDTTTALEDMTTATHPMVKQMADDWEDAGVQIVGAMEVTMDEIADLTAANASFITKEAVKIADVYKLTFATVVDTVRSAMGQLTEIVAQATKNQMIPLDNAHKKQMSDLDAWYAAQLAALGDMTDATQDQLDAKAALDKDYADKKAALDKEYADAQKPILEAQWKASHALALGNATISGIEAVVKTLAAYPFPWSLIPAAAIAALAAIQIGLIAAEPMPAFAQGADFVVPPGYEHDSYPMRVESGEHVTVTPAGQGGGRPTPLIIQIDAKPIYEGMLQATGNGIALINARSVVR